MDNYVSATIEFSKRALILMAIITSVMTVVGIVMMFINWSAGWVALAGYGAMLFGTSILGMTMIGKTEKLLIDLDE